VKVLFITREGYELSGARVRCYNFCLELVEQGIDARVFSFAEDLGAKYGEKELGMSWAEKIGLNIKAFRSLIKESSGTVFILQRLNYHALAPLLVAFLKKTPVVFDCDDWNIREDPVYHFGFYPSSKMEYLTRKIARRAKVCIAASRFLEGYLKSFNPNTQYLPTGVDTDLFCPQNERENPDIVFSWIGTAYHQEMGENVRFLLECFSEVADRYNSVVLSLAGEGSYFEAVTKEISSHKHKEKIELRSWISPDKIPEYLSRIDVGLLPLIQDTKFNKAKSPTKLFEYMSMAKATVSSSWGEALNIIRDGETGFLASDRDEFVARMCLLIEDQSLRKKMGIHAREDVVRNYSLKVIGQQLADILKSL